MQLADTMMTSEHEESEVIGGKLEDMKDCRAKMLEEWELKKKEYDQCMELQLFVSRPSYISYMNRIAESVLIYYKNSEINRIYYYYYYLRLICDLLLSEMFLGLVFQFLWSFWVWRLKE